MAPTETLLEQRGPPVKNTSNPETLLAGLPVWSKATLRYAAAMLGGGVAVMATAVIWRYVDLRSGYFLFPLIAVIVVSLRAGFGPAILTELLGGLGGAYLLLEPRGSFRIDTRADVLVLLLYTGVGVATAALGASVRSSYLRARALAAQQAELHGLARHRALQQAAVAGLGQRALAGMSVDDLVQAAAQETAAALSVEHVRILEIEEGLETLAGYTLACAKAVVFNDLPSDERFQPSPSLLALGVRSGMSVHVHGFGVLCACTAQPRTFTDDDAHFLESVANVLANTIRYRNADDALRRERDFNSALLDTAGALVVVADREGRIVRFNRACERVTGYSFEEVRGKRPGDLLLVPEEKASVMGLFAQIHSGEPTSRQENHWRAKNGELRLIAWSNTILVGPDGRVEHLIGTGIDITEQRRAEAQRVRLYQEAENAVKKRDEFLAMASHELKTPLTPLKLQAASIQRALRRQVPAAKLHDKVEVILRQVDRLSELVDDLLDVSRLTAGRLSLQIEAVDLAAVVRDVAWRFQVSLSRAGCDLRIIADEPVRGQWDRARLDQIVTNLMSNAAKYGPGKPIDIEIEADGETARLSVRDRGIGIAPENQVRIFERFERAAPEGAYSGLGLGLWIVRHVVEALGGTIRVESEIGVGSTFIVELPRRLPDLLQAS